jgi:2-iminobutanoate/2-iminopropanoate deaminase
MKKIIETDKAPGAIGPYSQAVQAGAFLYCSGQIPIDPKTNQVVMGAIGDQAKLVMENIKGLLTAAGYSLSDVVKTGIFLSDMAHFQTVNEVYSSYMTKPYPARSTVAVKALPKGVDVEIEVTAYKG